MKCLGSASCLSVSLFFILTTAISTFAQAKPGGSGGGTGRSPGTGSSNPRPTAPDSLPSDNPRTRTTFLSGTVAIDDGALLTDRAIIQSVCRGNVRNEGYTDSRGGFSFDLGDKTREVVALADESDVSGGGSNGAYKRSAPRDMRECELRAVLAGFSSQAVELASKLNDFGNTNVGTIVLHRLSQVEGFTISATSALAPPSARKEYDKGMEDLKKGKLDSAQQRFSKAVEIYPRYAVAWCELGRIQVHKNDVEAARNSFHQSITADSKFITPYGELAQLAMKGNQWKEALENTDALLALNPLNFPQYWYYNSLASFYLDDLAKAEKSALRCMAIDTEHKIPRAEYVLGIVLAKKGNYPEAAAHIRNYIRMSPNAPDINLAQRQIAELEKSIATAGSQNK